MEHVVLRPDVCKGCGLCVEFCPKRVLEIGSGVNIDGYNFVTIIENGSNRCTGCGRCVIICPDVAIGLVRVSPGEAPDNIDVRSVTLY